MRPSKFLCRRISVVGCLGALVLTAYLLVPVTNNSLQASGLEKLRARHAAKAAASCDNDGAEFVGDFEGSWYWQRSPEQEKRVVISLYNRYCIRCHGVDGRGVWDIPDVPDFTNGRWQVTRSDGQLARAILEGRGAVMPPFRGTLTLEEAWAMGRYLRTFVPGTEVSPPDTGKTDKPSPPKKPAK
ncbi:MAG TPA: cytochrome c [Gemmataceae bacterium]|nr:cytochrome c [Gemmataceae bacterium]